VQWEPQCFGPYSMTKPRTKIQKIGDYFDAYKCLQGDRKVKRSRAKDGSIPTHPVVVCPDVPESEVLSDCLAWLQVHGIMCDRHECGTVQYDVGVFVAYGIKGAGDIMGCLKSGIHFEIETKKGAGGRLSLGQQKRWRKVQESNGLYLVIHGLVELIYYKELLL